MESVPDVRAVTADIMLLALNKKSPVRSGTPNRAAEQISPQDIVSVLIVAREKGKGNEKKARVQNHLGRAP